MWNKLVKSDFDQLWDFSDPAVSEERFRDALREAVGLRERRAEILTQVARALGLQGRFDEGERALAEAAAIGASARVQVRIELEKGRLLRTAGDVAGSRVHFERAWEAAQRVDDWLALDAAHMLAIVEEGEAGRMWSRRGLEMASKSEDPDARKWRGTLLNNAGWACHDRGEFDEALVHFQEAARVRTEAGEVGARLIALWAVARSLRSLGRTEDALEVQLKLYGEHQQRGTEDGYNYEELGECLLLLGREEVARAHFARAHALLSRDSWLVGDQPARLERLQRLAGG